MNEDKEEKTFIETIETEEYIVEVFVKKEPRSEEEINRSMERLIKSRYKEKK